MNLHLIQGQRFGMLKGFRNSEKDDFLLVLAVGEIGRGRAWVGEWRNEVVGCGRNTGLNRTA
jgi:hypothetical protein